MKLLKEPLFHFMIIGAVLFVIYARFGGTGEVDNANKRIVVSAGRIEQLKTIFAKTWQRPPSDVELKGLIDDFVLEEIYYRQAIAMGIDRDDTVIRRRLRQKFEFLTDDLASLVDPTDEQLTAYLAANEDRFREGPRYTFQQIYFNPERHGDAPVGFVKSQLEALRAGKAVDGDPTLIPASFNEASEHEIDGLLGTGVSKSFIDLKIGEWQGPLRSGLGLHLIRIESCIEGGLPKLIDIRSIVEREWAYAQRNKMRSDVNDQYLNEYEVIIESEEGAISKSPNGTKEP